MAIPTFIYLPNGEVRVNKTKANVKSFWVTSDPNSVVIPALGTVRQVPYKIDTQGHFEWAYLMSTQTSPAFLLNFFDPGTRRNLMNNPIHAATLLGTAQRQGILVETYMLNTENAGRELQVDFTDLSGAPNTVRTVLHGRRWYQNEAPPDVQADMRKRFAGRERTTAYWLTTQVSPIVLGASGELINNLAPIIRADDEADTEVFKLTAFSTGAFEFRLRELASNRSLSNDFVRVESGFGTAQFPFVFQESLLIERNYDVAIDIRDLSAAPNTIFLTFWCRRLWYR